MLFLKVFYSYIFKHFPIFYFHLLVVFYFVLFCFWTQSNRIQIYLTYWWDPNRYYHPSSEWTWSDSNEGVLHSSPKLKSHHQIQVSYPGHTTTHPEFELGSPSLLPSTIIVVPQVLLVFVVVSVAKQDALLSEQFLYDRDLLVLFHR